MDAVTEMFPLKRRYAGKNKGETLD